jgi:hypothetical protein
MDPISRLDQVMQLIGRQMSERAARLDSGVRAPPAAPAPRAAARPSLAALRQRVRERLQQIDPDDPKRAEKARRAFLESVLVWQFGKELLLEPGFAETVAGVQEVLRVDPELESRLSQLLSELADASD